MTLEQAKQILADAQVSLPTTDEGMAQLKEAIRIVSGTWMVVS